MKPLDFIATAKDLAKAPETTPPRETNLRRAVSTAYYAVFSCLAECCAETLVGNETDDRTQTAGRRIYRLLDHGPAKSRCESKKGLEEFAVEIQDLATAFVNLQQRRHQADYDPDPLLDFSLSTVRTDILAAEKAISAFSKVSEVERRAFAAYLLARPGRD